MTEHQWQRYIKHMTNLVKSDAPSFLKAHYLVHVLFTRIARQVGIKEVAEELGRMFTKGLSLYTGVCVCCNKSDAVQGDDVCVKCLADIDQVQAEVEADE